MPGPTGRYPRGKLGPDDEGELEISIGDDDERDVVIVDFGARIHSLGLPPEQAMELGAILLQRGSAMIHRQRARAGKEH